MRRFIASLIFVNICYCMLWKKGVVYFTINKLDYDVHSQDEITTTFSKLQEEICIKFFHQPLGNQSNINKLLFISNPDKIKNCQPNKYDFSKKIITMPIGYKCINEKAIARFIAEMLRASIQQTVSNVNSFDLIQKFHEKDQDPSRQNLLTAVDRNFINAYYHGECGLLTARVGHTARRQDDEPSLLSNDNVEYYKDKLWPLGIVMYGVEETLRYSKNYELLRHSMTSIELSSCIVFEEVNDDQVLTPKNMLYFGSNGVDIPLLGFQPGNQTIKLEEMVHGAPGHTAHTLNNLLRILGIHMMSNRFDRDNYISINWKNVVSGKERLLDKTPRSAWLERIAYDFNSATHAPVNFVCRGCELGANTVQPLQDLLWQKTMSMGHRTDLSESDINILKILYAKECRDRFSGDKLKE